MRTSPQTTRCARRWRASQDRFAASCAAEVVVALEFRTVPDELLGIASAAMDLLKSRGYTVTPERRETGYPFAPTLHGKRGSETGFVEGESKVAVDRMRQWVAYGRSCKADTRVWCALPEDAKRSGKEDRQLKELGVGLILV